MPNLSLEEIAGSVNLSRSRLSHLFEEQLHQSVQKYRDQEKIKKAKQLLENTNLSLTQIALEIGIVDPNYFLKFFKKYTQLSPTAYRNMLEQRVE